MEIRPLRETDDRLRFQSSDPDLDRFFREIADTLATEAECRFSRFERFVALQKLIRVYNFS